MFGFKSSNEPLQGQDAKNIRDLMERVQSGQLNSQDQEWVKLQNEESAYSATWN